MLDRTRELLEPFRTGVQHSAATGFLFDISYRFVPITLTPAPSFFMLGEETAERV